MSEEETKAGAETPAEQEKDSSPISSNDKSSHIADVEAEQIIEIEIEKKKKVTDSILYDDNFVKLIPFEEEDIQRYTNYGEMEYVRKLELKDSSKLYRVIQNDDSKEIVEADSAQEVANKMAGKKIKSIKFLGDKRRTVYTNDDFVE